MDLGFALPTSGPWVSPDALATVAREAEARGLRTLWTFQRLLYPTSPSTGPGGRPGAQWPSVYRSVLDPLVALGYAAAVTDRIRLGVAVVNGPFYSPILLAKMLASLDVLSGGRLDAGVGLGWSPEEYAASGVPMERRGRRLDEFLNCLTTLLSEDPASFAGEFYEVPESYVEPLPVQRPRPPVLVGGGSDAAFRRAATYDGWVSASAAGLEGIAAGVQKVRACAEQLGRDPADLRCVSRGTTRVREADVAHDDRGPLTGSVAQIRDDLDRFRDAGVDELFLDLNFDSDEVGAPDADPERALDRALRLMEAMAP